MNITTIKDTVKALAQSLQVTTVLPASLFVFVNVYLILPDLWPGFSPESSSVLTLAISLTLMGSYTLYAFNFPLIRFLEGHKMRRSDLSQWLLQKKREQFKELLSQIEALTEERLRFKNRLGFDPDKDSTSQLSKKESRYWGFLKSRSAELEYELDRHYPSTIDSVLPTKLGNTIAAFEDYPRTRYGMDTVALWPRLVPLLKEEKYTDFVTQEKSVFDFLLNMFAVVVALSIELIYLNLFLGRLVVSIGIAIVSPIISYMLYEGMSIAARQWGTTVRVAFDLYRYDLRQRLGLCPAKTFGEEYQRWQEVSQFLLFRRKGTWFNGFISQFKMEKSGKEEGKQERKEGETEENAEEEAGISK